MEYSKLFHHILGNDALAGFLNMLLWFALTFWAYLETQSVFVTGMLGGIYLVLNLLTGIWFGSLVDHHRKKTMMMFSSIISLTLYTGALYFYFVTASTLWQDPTQLPIWILICLIMMGQVVGNIRIIALPPLVTLLIPEQERDKANGKVGMIQGLMFTGVSAFSGILVGKFGIELPLVIAIIGTVLCIIHLSFLFFPEEPHILAAEEDGTAKKKKVDLRGTIRIIAGIPGLFPLIFFAMWNNFLGGVFMALMDAYGLSLVSVESWGILLALTSTGFIIGGTLVSKFGLGKNPVKTLLLGNLVMWSVCIIFPLYASIWLIVIGFFTFMTLSPFVEASEQTIFQKVVPLQRQGRVFGLSQSMENIASPLTAFLVGPLTQFWIIPWLGSNTNTIIEEFWGRSPDRAMALVFVATGILGIIITSFAFYSKSYQHLTQRYQES